VRTSVVAATSALRLRAPALALEASLARRARRLRRAARPRTKECAAQQVAQPSEDRGDVLRLVPVAVRGEDEVPVERQPRRELLEDERAVAALESRRAKGVPAQDRLRRDLVDVLPAGAAGGRVRELDLGRRDPDARRHLEEG